MSATKNAPNEFPRLIPSGYHRGVTNATLLTYEIRGRIGSGGLCGLQNRWEAPLAALVGSIPTRSRQFSKMCIG
jgi:hypothetical protein